MSYPPVSQAVSGGYYMQNLVSIAEWLMAQGFSRAAAAGVAGTIAGESAGNPESVGSGGAGLIGWTPPSSASPHYPIVTNNWQTDFDNQLQDLLNYANNNSAEAVARGGVNLDTLKKATSPTQAASWWSAFEGPLVPGSDVRDSVATSVYDALSGYKVNEGWKTTGNITVTSSQGGGGGGGAGFQIIEGIWSAVNPFIGPIETVSGAATGIADIATALQAAVNDFAKFLKLLVWIFVPKNWLRVGAFIFGALALGAGVYFLREAL